MSRSRVHVDDYIALFRKMMQIVIYSRLVFNAAPWAHLPASSLSLKGDKTEQKWGFYDECLCFFVSTVIGYFILFFETLSNYNLSRRGYSGLSSRALGLWEILESFAQAVKLNCDRSKILSSYTYYQAAYAVLRKKTQLVTSRTGGICSLKYSI